MLATEDIAMQRYSNACAHATIINLFKLRGLNTPSFEDVDRALDLFSRTSGTRFGDQDSPKLIDMLGCLTASGFLCSLVAIPPALHEEPQTILTPYLCQGAQLIISFNWREPETGVVIPHVTLVEGFNDLGYNAIDGEPGYLPDGARFELEPALTSAQIRQAQEWLASNDHGSRKCLPFFAVAQNMPGQLVPGLLPLVIVVHDYYANGGSK